MKKLSKVLPQDFGLVPANPDPGFNPEHNAMVIENTIKKYEANRRAKMASHEEAVKQRAEAVAFFLKANQTGKVTSDIRKFFGESLYRQLSGKEKRLKDSLTVMNEQGKVLRRAGE